MLSLRVLKNRCFEISYEISTKRPMFEFYLILMLIIEFS